MDRTGHYLVYYHPQHVALCPWFAETKIVDADTKDKVLKKSPLKFVGVDRVGEAFALAATEQRWVLVPNTKVPKHFKVTELERRLSKGSWITFVSRAVTRRRVQCVTMCPGPGA